jgi:molecular chaperone GrpE
MPSSQGVEADEQREPPRQERRGSETHDVPGQDGLNGSGQGELDREDLAARLARSEDLYKRALADLENYRKRSSRELERRTGEVKESMLIDWLDAVDSVERAVQMELDGPCRDGLQAVMGQMDGEPFDPERHEAIAVRTSPEAPDQTVLEVQRPGFALGSRVIRPAQVVVARASEHAR